MSDENEPSAYEKAVAGYELFGEPLRKWSYSRKNAADRMGLRFPAIGPDWQAWQRDGRFKGCRCDCAIILWLLSLKDSSELSKDEIKAQAWTPERAFMNPDAALLASADWANEQPWGEAMSEQFTDALQVAFAVVLDVPLSSFTVETTETATSGKKKVSSKPRAGCV